MRILSNKRSDGEAGSRIVQVYADDIYEGWVLVFESSIVIYPVVRAYCFSTSQVVPRNVDRVVHRLLVYQIDKAVL